MIWIIVGVAAVVLIVLWIIYKGRIYNRIFAPEHYVEFAQSLSAATVAGCDKINEPPSNPPTDDPRVFVTTAGVAFMYTVAEDKNEYAHQFSISIAGRYTPHAVGGPFTIYVARLLGIDLADLHVRISPRNVHHSVFILPKDEHAKFRNREITIPSIEAAREIHAECMNDIQKLRCERFNPDTG